MRNILTPSRTFHSANGDSKKKILEFIADNISREVAAIDDRALFEELVARERLGTTGLGNGVAIPHCRCSDCTEPIGLFMKLENPVDYDAVDQKPVDLVFALIVPKEENQEHLEILSFLAELFQSEKTLKLMRAATSQRALFECVKSKGIASINTTI